MGQVKRKYYGEPPKGWTYIEFENGSTIRVQAGTGEREHFQSAGESFFGEVVACVKCGEPLDEDWERAICPSCHKELIV